MQAEEAKRLTQLEKQNARLEPKASPQEEKLLSEAELEKAMLQPHARRSHRSWPRETSEPGTPTQGCGGPACHVPGV